MTISSSGIREVRAIAIPAGIGRDGRCFDDPLNVLVTWRSSHTDKLHQVYVNGKLAGATEDIKQRRIRLYVSTCWQSVSRIAVYAVEPEFQYEDYSEQFEDHATAGRIVLRWTRTQSLPFGGRYEVYSNNGNGQIDYSSSVAGGKGVVWPSWQYKSGLGLSKFGVSDFGYDGSACPGFGRGSFGGGEFGFGADEIEWISDELNSGTYQFEVKIFDSFGIEQMAAVSDEMTVIRAAKGIGSVELEPCEEDGIMSFRIDVP